MLGRFHVLGKERLVSVDRCVLLAGSTLLGVVEVDECVVRRTRSSRSRCPVTPLPSMAWWSTAVPRAARHDGRDAPRRAPAARLVAQPWADRFARSWCGTDEKRLVIHPDGSVTDVEDTFPVTSLVAPAGARSAPITRHARRPHGAAFASGGPDSPSAWPTPPSPSSWRAGSSWSLRRATARRRRRPADERRRSRSHRSTTLCRLPTGPSSRATSSSACRASGASSSTRTPVVSSSGSRPAVPLG